MIAVIVLFLGGQFALCALTPQSAAPHFVPPPPCGVTATIAAADLVVL